MRPRESRRLAGLAQGQHGDTTREWTEPADAAATSATQETLGLRTSPLPGRGPGLLSRFSPFPPLRGRLPAGENPPGLGLCRLRLYFDYLLCNLLFFSWKGHTSPRSSGEGRASAGSAVRPAGRAQRGPPASGPRPRAAGCRPGGGGCSRRRGGGWGGRAARRPPLPPPPQPPPPRPPRCLCFSLWSEAAVMADGGLWRRRRLL